jgi:N-acetylmuramoyl-L-alanine amidase
MQRSPNWDVRTLPVSLLVLHYTGMPTAAEALARLCDPAAKVSAHYLVDVDGTVHDLVDEAHRAWHAGLSYWHSIFDVNSASIGIEIVNPGHEWGYQPFPPQQIGAVIDLGSRIRERHQIPPWGVIGHSDVAPARKIDPGELFPWRELAAASLGLWPRPGQQADDGRAFPALLNAYGYDVRDEDAAVTAFHRHFYPDRLGQPADRESRRRVLSLLAQKSVAA